MKSNMLNLVLSTQISWNENYQKYSPSASVELQLSSFANRKLVLVSQTRKSAVMEGIS